MSAWTVKVEYHAARAPWETPVERSHSVGLRTLRACYTPQKLARATAYDLCKIYDHVTLMMNTSPICEHVLDHQAGSSSSTFITADSPAFGYTRSTGLLLKSVDGDPIPNLHASRPVAVENIRKAFLAHHWQALRDRCAQQTGRKPSKHIKPLDPGSTVLIRYKPRNKCDVGVHVGHIVSADISPDGLCRRYRVRSTLGYESVENHCNVVPLDVHSPQECALTRGACCRSR
ncbi:hypothetical protein Pmar_PMAR027344 [Perkinsus marinus ATCC 50983]|uniref:Uncharacterized protein n=1 Tax=Perkinsus marinus (strain ATCC 50983 / TXsc) TaxID=423536 RepID=C5L9R7_PERM5|nr:hypothetical protein Pmar_PMAR027344 [Perkinsus marinus ATCC 50983]EER06526.1 hypothetical protein Pmar_PMAR027344 [Perkinsus marinus ATCC 50983]|eukprot:XP_002774710.1 hypothetical protein Pmar_PMAR027344 [Perkinsus marinus ATCC 50983]